jgi:hypothetical protein
MDIENGRMQPKWTDGDILPLQLVNIFEDTLVGMDESENEEDSDSLDDDSVDEYESCSEDSDSESDED